MTKYVMCGLVGLCIGVCIWFWYVYTDMRDTISTLSLQNEECQLNLKEQTEAIQKYRVNEEEYLKAIEESKIALSKERKEKEELLDKELSKDSSDTNQLRLAKELLNEFSKGN